MVTAALEAPAIDRLWGAARSEAMSGQRTGMQGTVGGLEPSDGLGASRHAVSRRAAKTPAQRGAWASGVWEDRSPA
jgi:hypothetical protein